VVATSLFGPLAERGSAQPFAGTVATGHGADGTSLITKVHGFHCRSVLGWDPVAGIYHYHRHEGICRDYQRCLSKQKRCIFLLGRGWERWSYERFGSDNSRFSACMIRAGCY
jgi:hypothetical protein